MQAEDTADLHVLATLSSMVLMGRLANLFEEALGRAAWLPYALVQFIQIAAQAQIAFAFLPLTPTGKDQVAQALYCNMTQASDGSWPITASILYHWSYALTATGLNFVGLQVGLLRQMIISISLYQWQHWAAQASGQTSALCTLYDCAASHLDRQQKNAINGGATIGVKIAHAIQGGATIGTPLSRSITGGSKRL